mmetsp:Transcript_100026/g.250785  ORF Transcript_100026/g.250785 Transcript_100026/m.250785 type:complete len:581 (+) Transcript_100026:86-1828(+)
MVLTAPSSSGARMFASSHPEDQAGKLTRSRFGRGAMFGVLVVFAIVVILTDMAMFRRGFSLVELFMDEWQFSDGREEFMLCAIIFVVVLLREYGWLGSSGRRGLVGAASLRKKDTDVACSRGAAACGVPEVAVPSSEAIAKRSAAAIKCNEAIDRAALEGNAEKAGQLLLDFERAGGKADHRHYNSVIRAHAKCGNPVSAERWLRRMVNKGVPRTLGSYNMLLDAYAKTDNAEACEKWLQHLIEDGIEANVTSYASAIYAHARRGDAASAEKWLKRMVAAGIDPDAATYNVLILSHGVKGNASGAEAWLAEMRTRGLEVSVCTYTAVINAVAKSGDMSAAERWFQRMLEEEVQPSVATFSAMMDACAKAGDMVRAEQWHDRMIQHGIAPNAHTCGAMVNACAKARSPHSAEAAERWLDFSENAGVLNDVVVYSSVIDACAKAGDAERAMRIFRRMQAKGLKPHILAYTALARPFAYRGDWIKVESIAQEMIASGIERNEYFVYAQLVSYSASQPRQGHSAEQCFRSAIAEGIPVNDHIVSALARSVGRPRCAELMKELCGGREVPARPRPAQGRKLGGRA